MFTTAYIIVIYEYRCSTVSSSLTCLLILNYSILPVLAPVYYQSVVKFVRVIVLILLATREFAAIDKHYAYITFRLQTKME